LRAYFRRHNALAIDNEDGTLDVHLLKPFSDREDERALVRSYLRVWKGRAAFRSNSSSSGRFALDARFAKVESDGSRLKVSQALAERSQEEKERA
jgi:hypothetical protein